MTAAVVSVCVRPGRHGVHELRTGIPSDAARDLRGHPATGCRQPQRRPAAPRGVTLTVLPDARRSWCALLLIAAAGRGRIVSDNPREGTGALRLLPAHTIEMT